MATPFLFPHQRDAVEKCTNGCILNGGVGSGKSRTALYYYFKEMGGSIIDNDHYVPMKAPIDLYIITTAKKRDNLEWRGELGWFRMSIDSDSPYSPYNHTIVIDSWQNIQKYKDIKDAFFIFDEDKVTGDGAWVKAFWEIAKSNKWIVLSATPGDTWMDYMAVFVANGFYKNKTDFVNQHVIYARFVKFDMVDRYVDTRRLVRLRDKILISMDFVRSTTQHHSDIIVSFDMLGYRDIMKRRWNPYTNKPIKNAGELCYTLRKFVNSDLSRMNAVMDVLEKTDTAIIFYNFDYELEMLRSLFHDNPDNDYVVAEWNGHLHQEIPTCNRWVYLVQYTAGCEGWNCITSNTIIFLSQNYSYKVVEQAVGRIDRMNTPYKDLYYYHIKSRSTIDLGISRALSNKKKFNEGKWSNKYEKESSGRDFSGGLAT